VIEGTWTYSPSLNPPIPTQFNPAREAIRTVKTPLGDKTDHFFSVALDESGGWTQFEYGLPFSRFESDGAGRFLSTRARDCDSAGANCVLKRASYVAYERDAGFFSDFQINMDRNRRVSATSTTYHDDGNRVQAESYSSFDGLGHYRTTVLSGSFDAGNGVRIETVFGLGCEAPFGAGLLIEGAEEDAALRNPDR